MPFCLTIPRAPGSQLMPQVLTALTNIGGALTGSGVQAAADDGNLVLNIRDLLSSLGPQGATAPAATSDTAGLAFRFEFIVNTLTIHPGDYFRPGKVENGKIVPDPNNPDKDVRILLPKIVFEYTQGDVYTQAPTFRLKSWGQSGFFGVADAQMGELIRMQPDVAIYKGGAFGISLGPVILDLSTNNTPPEILSLYGTDEAFTGVYAKKFRIYVNFGERLFSFAVELDDLLYSINEGWVSLEGDLSLFGPDVNFSIEVQAYEDGAGKEYNTGEVGSTYEAAKPGSLVIKQGSWLQAVMIGGVPPYQSLDVQFKFVGADDVPQSVNLTAQLDATGRNLQLINLPVPYGELVFTATDADNPPQQAVRRIELLGYAQNAVQPGLPTSTTVFQRQNALWIGGQNGDQITHTPSPGGTLEMLEVDSDRTVYDIKAELFHDPGYTQHLATVTPLNGRFAVDVPPGKTIYVRVTINEGMGNPTLLEEYFDLWFDYERPRIDEFPAVSDDYADNFTTRPHKLDGKFMEIQPPSAAAGKVAGQGADLLYDWLTKRVQAQNNGKVIEVIGVTFRIISPGFNFICHRLKWAQTEQACYQGE